MSSTQQPLSSRHGWRTSLTRTLMPILFALAVLLSSTPAHAADSRTDVETILASIERLAVTNDQLREDAESLASNLEQFEELYMEDTASAASDEVAAIRDLIDTGHIATHLPEEAGFHTSGIKIWTNEPGETIVFVPYVGSVVAPSGMTVLLDADGDVVQTFETVYQAMAADSGTVAVWLDGELEEYVLVNASGTVTELESSPEEEVSQQAPQALLASWWDDFTYCLGDIMTVPSWVISGISIACAVGCAISAGVGCIACVTGAATAYGSAVSFCVGWASGG